MHEKQLRIRYIRLLEKFFTRTISLLKLENFEFDKFKERTLKNFEDTKRVESVELTSTYMVGLKKFIDLTLHYLEFHSEDFQEEKDHLLKEANLLQKEKNRSQYKKDKHKNQKFDDGY